MREVCQSRIVCSTRIRNTACAALASELKAVHAFQEDLREALGLVSLYNESLGTVSTEYLYDRVQGRDRGVPKRPWE